MTTPISGYRFVPFKFEGDVETATARVVEGPIGFDALNRGHPHAEGSISGTLEMTWESETPVCIGEKDSTGTIVPFAIGNKGCLPGASLRGMLRAVMETASFGHLGRINDHRHFGFRDFSDKENYRNRLQADKIKAGWLTHTGDGWQLTIALEGGKWYPVPVAEVLRQAGITKLSTDNWRMTEIHNKRCELARCAPHMLQPLRFWPSGQYFADVRWGSFSGSGSGKQGYLVCSGAATDATRAPKNEVFVGGPARSASSTISISDKFMDLFARINGNPGLRNPQPTGAWEYWLSQKIEPGSPAPVPGCQLPGIPVFFYGDPKEAEAGKPFDPLTCGFVMGLSRALKIPYRKGVSHVAAETFGMAGQYKTPPLKERLDFARAIFGWLDIEEDAEGRPIGRDRARADVNGLAGRVAVSPAFTTASPQLTQPQTFIFGQPRESFYPYYLDGNYHGGPAKLIGRKRYPVRPQAAAPAIDPSASDRTQSRVVFHRQGTRYAGKIRIHNLHPVEFGALVWCLTFGKQGGRWRHSIGRAKGYGYGRLRLQSLKWSRPPRTVNWPANDDLQNFDALAGQFEQWMSKRLGSDFAKNPAIMRLRAYANPAAAARAPQKDQLCYPEVENFKKIKESGIPLGASETWNPDASPDGMK